ncbi:uncharacterized protein [Montipora capricornis]|uniref:uncharacterized protein n=1 Tax=Montipora capricornis TaxID=246305 RepID=UPI0035F10786
MAPKAVQSKRQKESKDKPRSKEKKLKENTWNKGQTFIFATVFSCLEGRDKPWALVLETLALKKSANESVFRKILEEFEDALEKEGKYVEDENYLFTVDQLRVNYKWLKHEWKRINTKIKTGSGQGAKDTELPTWSDVLDPLFSESCDNMSVSSKASDKRDSDEDSGDESPTGEECESVSSVSVLSYRSDMARRKVSLSPLSFADVDVTESGISGGKDTKEEEIEENGDGRPQKKLAKTLECKLTHMYLGNSIPGMT